MSKKSIMIQATLRCESVGPSPFYRAWLDQELFAERVWRFEPHQGLEEIWQIRARPGRYQLRYELIGNGQLIVDQWQVLRGSAGVDPQGHLVIHDA